MAPPNPAELVAAIQAVADKINAVLTRLLAIPDNPMNSELGSLQAELNAALAAIDPAALEAEFAKALAAIKAAKGISGGGADSSTA